MKDLVPMPLFPEKRKDEQKSAMINSFSDSSGRSKWGEHAKGDLAMRQKFPKMLMIN
ncbi:MAG: hypothetical protein JXA96_05195 [Sedimentisphaerales bacterium]|nr:hypothetical protein [Sedimentisphaerales bacterium]